jgi:hypothetical protein
MLTEKNSKILLWFGIILFAIGIFLFLWKESFSGEYKINSEKIAQFGDFIGGIIGSVWSLAGVILFYVALTEQREDIKINREALNAQVSALHKQIEEFELQRDELKETRKVFKEQSETLKIQRFENTFFQLINLHHEIIDKLTFGKSEPIEKREVFSKGIILINKNIYNKNTKQAVKDNFSSFGDVKIPFPAVNKEEAEHRLIEAYSKFYYEETAQLFSHYYRNIYHIFKFIYTSSLVENHKKQFYASLIRAQLSSDELSLIYYNSIIINLGYPNFLFLIKEYDIMQNFDLKLIYKNPFYEEIFLEKLENIKPVFELRND